MMVNMWFRRSVLASLLALAWALAPMAAWADDAALAQELFDEGHRLMEAGDYDNACPKFKGSHEAEPSVGALLNLARCHEKLGRVASAWAEYRAAAALARRLGQDERAIKSDRLAEDLEPTLSRLTIRVSERYPGLEVRRDDEVVPESAWGQAMPVDPGRHRITAEAPGKRTYETFVDVAADADRADLVIPQLNDAPTPAAPEDDSGLGALDVGAIAAGSVGIACLAVGGALGAVALSQRANLAERCGDDLVCDRPIDVASETSNIESIAHGSTAMFVVGGVGVGVAAALWLVGAFADDTPEEPVVGFGFDGRGGYFSLRRQF